MSGRDYIRTREYEYQDDNSRRPAVSSLLRRDSPSDIAPSPRWRALRWGLGHDSSGPPTHGITPSGISQESRASHAQKEGVVELLRSDFPTGGTPQEAFRVFRELS